MALMFGGKKSLPAQSSVLAPGPLLEAARQHYGIAREATAEFLHRGVNDVYAITAPEERYALRVYRHGGRLQPEIQWELSLLEHLAGEDAPVAGPLRTRSGNPFSIVLAPEGPRFVALFRYVEGKVYAGDAMNALQARAYGRALAAVHLRMDTFEPTFPRFEIDLEHLLVGPLAALAPRMTERPQDLTYLRRVGEDIREAVVEFDDRGMSRGLCLGDATTAGARLDRRGEFTFFDFDSAGSGWRMYDLGTFRWSLLRFMERRKADEAYSAFLEGYRDVRGLSKVDEDAVPPFVAAREIWHLGRRAELAASDGFASMDDRYFDTAINFLHDWYKEMLAYS